MDGNLTKSEIQRLIDYINLGEERIASAKKIVINNTNDFNIWYKYSSSETRYNYPSMLGLNTLIGKVFYNHLKWLGEEEYFGIVIDVEFVLETIENLLYLELLTKNEVEQIKKEIVKLNFGSMKNIW